MNEQSINELLSTKGFVSFTSTPGDGNMSYYRSNGKPYEVLLNRIRFLERNGIPIIHTVTMGAVHGIDVVRVGREDFERGTFELEERGPLDVDGLVTNEKDVYLVLHTGDCVPISVFDPATESVGLGHAGWEGSEVNIAGRLIEVMKREFNSDPKNLIIKIGPSIGPCHYGGPPRLRSSNNPIWNGFISKDADANHGVDIWGLVESQLVKAGVLIENIFNPRTCTYENYGIFSHKLAVDTNSENDFRFLTVVGIKP